MTQIVVKVSGDGISRFNAAVQRLGSTKVDQEIKRGLIDGGRRTTTAVKKGLVRQTGIKRTVLNRKVTGFYDPSRDAWVIKGQGAGVPFGELQKVSVKPLARRSVFDQPRDAMGRFAKWPDPMREKGRVTASVWGARKRFAWSLGDGGVFKTMPPDAAVHRMFGPAPWKELVKDQSAAAFHQGAIMTQGKIEGRLVKLSGGALSRG